MTSSAPTSPRPSSSRPSLRPPLLSSRSIPSSPTSPPPSSATTAALLSPRASRQPSARNAFAMAPTTSSSSPSSFLSLPPSTSAGTPPLSATSIAGMLRVEVMSARNLHAAVLGSLLKWTPNTSNPYVVVTLHRDEFTTTTKELTLNPTWKEMGQLKVPLPSEQELLQTVGTHRSIFDTSGGGCADTAGKLAGNGAGFKFLGASASGVGGKDAATGEFHACFPHLEVQVFHQTELQDSAGQPVAGSRSRRALDKLIGEVSVPILPCIMSDTSSHRAWYTLLSDEHPDAGQIQISMNYDVGGIEPLKGDIVRPVGFGGMEYYAKLINANARLEVVDVFQDQVLAQCKSLEGWMLSFEFHRNLLFVVRRPSILRDAQDQLQGQIVRVRHSPLVARAHRVWEVVPQSQRRQLTHLYQLAVFSGGAVYTVASKSVATTRKDGVRAGVHSCVSGSTEAVSQVSLEALRLFWSRSSSSSAPKRPTRTEDMRRHLEGGPLTGRGKVVQAFGDVAATETLTIVEGRIDEEEKTEEMTVVFTVDPEVLEFDAEEDQYDNDNDITGDAPNEYDDESKTNDDPWGDNVPDQLICPITGCPMLDPVVAADGHSYEREAILQWFSSSNKSPMTGAQMPTTQVFPNFTLRKLSEEFQSKIKATKRRGSGGGSARRLL